MRLIFDSDGTDCGEIDQTGLIELYRFSEPADRAYIRSNFVSSLDGSIQGTDGRSGGINTESDHEIFALQRALADAVLVGAGTARTEGYRAIDLAPWQLELREREGLAPYPTLVIVSGSADLDPAIATPETGPGGPVTIITTAGKSQAQLAPLREAGVEIVESADDELDLRLITDRLAGSGLIRLICEGGPGLHRDLIAAGLLDELLLTVAPVVVGGDGLRSTSGGSIENAHFALRFALFADDGTLFTSYGVSKPST